MNISRKKPIAVMLSKRANVFYLEHVRILQKENRVVYLTERDNPIEQFFNIPERNTAFVLLGKGTSITDAAIRKLADANVIVGFCGSGGSPLFAATDYVFLEPQSEYRPTEYMQSWLKIWFDDTLRLEKAKILLQERLEFTALVWQRNKFLIEKGIIFPKSQELKFHQEILTSASITQLLLAEARWAKSIYSLIASSLKLPFTREEGKGAKETVGDLINSYIDHGNYIAYGFAAVALHGLGISFSLPLLHGKTRRGALVFDLADLIKDAFVLPLSFEFGLKRRKSQDFRDALIEICQREEVLDYLFSFILRLIKKDQ